MKILILLLPFPVLSIFVNTWCEAKDPTVAPIIGAVCDVSVSINEDADGNCAESTPCVWEYKITITGNCASGISAVKFRGEVVQLSSSPIVFADTITSNCASSANPPILFLNSTGIVIGVKRINFLCADCEEQQ